MKDPLSFDHRPDLVLGKALREALDPGDAPAFIARVLAHAEHVRTASHDATRTCSACARTAAALRGARFWCRRAGTASPASRSAPVRGALITCAPEAPPVAVP